MESSSSINVTVVIPVYNCAHWIVQNLNHVVMYFSEIDEPWELIVVDDGSHDQTAEVVRNYIKGVSCASLIENKNNLGKGAAVLTGLRAGRGKYRLFMDCDLAYPLLEASKLIAALELGGDVAIANRRMPESVCELRPSLFKQVYSRYKFGCIFNSFVRLLGLTKCTDTQAGLKSMRGEVIDLLEGMTVSRFAFDIELLHILELYKKNIVSVPIRYGFFEEVSSVKILRDGFRMLREVFGIKMNTLLGKYEK